MGACLEYGKPVYSLMHTVIETRSICGLRARWVRRKGTQSSPSWRTIRRRALIPGSGGLRKVRFAKPGKGKRGGYRTIHYYAADDVPVFLMALVAKGETDISAAERNQLKKEVAAIADDYREGVRKKLRKVR